MIDAIGPRSLLLASGLLCLLAAAAPAQSPDEHITDSLAARNRFGVVVGMGLNLHTADFTELPGIPNCSPGFRFGFGIAPVATLLYEHRLGFPWLLQARVGFTAEGATLTRAEQSFVDIDGRAVLIDIDHAISASLGTIALEPLAGYRLGSRLSLLGGAHIGYRLTSTYSQKEQLADNARQGSFENGRRVRNESAGVLPGALPVAVALLAGASYEVPLNASGTLLAAPELMLSYGLTPVLSQVRWSTHALRAGIALKYAPRAAADTVPSPMPVMTPASPPAPALAARIDAAGVGEDGVEEPVARLRVEEFIAAELHPLLGYVFFGRGSAELDPRYVRVSAGETAGFDTTSLYGAGTLGIYRQLLNIVGLRMLEHRSARLHLHGTTDGTTAEDRALARRRAETVAGYLRDVWGVASDRLDVTAGESPSQPSNGSYPEGIEENRRVELTSDDHAILRPLRASTPPAIRFHPVVESAAGVRSWRVQARQEGRVVKEFSGEGPVPAVLEWRIDRDEATFPRAPGEIHYALEVVDSMGARAEAALGTLGVEQVTVRRKRSERLADMEVERYSLILFDYDRAELTADHREMLEEIKAKIGEKSRVIITGYADRLGDAAHNQKLALERARAVARELGVGEDRLGVIGAASPPYENETPEGRLYSRTVSVEIRTPVVEGRSG